MKRYAVIPTRDRPEKYARCYAAIRPQVDEVVTIAHHLPEYVKGVVVAYTEEPPNISRMWNIGLDTCLALARKDEHLVAVLNDDAQVSAHWFDLVAAAMQREGTVLGCGPKHQGMIAGWAFVLKGGTIRADESWAWWVSDNYICEQADLHWGGWSSAPAAEVWHYGEPLAEGPLRTRAEADVARYVASGQQATPPERSQWPTRGWNARPCSDTQ